MTEKKNTRVIAFANQKGGVSKTSSALNVCYAFTELGKNVLLIDMDSQASASLNLGIDVDEEEIGTIDALLQPMITNQVKYRSWAEIQSCIQTPTFTDRQRDPENKMQWITLDTPFGVNGRYDIIPSSILLAVVELQMGLASGSAGRYVPIYLERIIDVIKKFGDYDYIVLDCPPSLSGLFLNSVYAAIDGVIAVSSLDIMSLRGIDNLIESVESVSKIRPDHRGILGIMFGLFSERRKVDKDLNYYAKKYLPIPVFDSKIPESADAKKANSSMLLLSQLNKKCNAAYIDLANEIDFAISNPDEPVGSQKYLEPDEESEDE